MIRPVMVLLFALVFGTTAFGAVSNDVKRLPLRRAVEASTSGWVEVEEDSALAASCRPDFADLRVVTGEGEVLPVTHAPARRDERVIHHVLRRSMQSATTSPDLAPGETMLEFDTAPWIGRELVVEFTNPDHRAHARYSTQTRNRDWTPSLVNDTARLDPLVEALQQGNISRLRVIVPVRGDAEDSLFVGYIGTLDAPRETITTRETRAGFDRREYVLQLEIVGGPRAVGELRMSIPGGFEARDLSVEADFQDQGWRAVRIDQPDPATPVQTISWDPVRTGALRIVVRGADPPNVPIRIDDVRAIPRRFRFLSPASGPAAWLVFGDPYLASPVNTERRPASAQRPTVASLGPTVDNPWYEGEPGGIEWVKRRRWVLPGAMLLVLAFVAWMALAGRPIDDPDAT